MTDPNGGAVPVADDPAFVLGDRGAPPPRRRGRRVAAILGVLVLLLVVAAGGVVYLLSESIGNNVVRVPNVFGPLNADARPPAQASLTFLLVGTDTRSAEPTTGSDAPAGVNPGSQRSDVIMLAEVSPDRTSASVVSIPRDSWVDIPGRGKNKINAAYAFGGASLLASTVEQLTGVHVDHFAVIDFAGFQAMVDAVDGIDVQVAQATSDRGVAFREGFNHLDGADALVYVRQRYGLPNGDLDRAKREQNALKSLLAKAASSGTLADPIKLYRFLDATSRSVSVDDTLTNEGFRSLALESRGLRPSAVTFLTSPVRGVGREGVQSVVYLADDQAAMWSAFRSGTVADFARQNPGDLLGARPS
jgi:LCP family protein required for cell wall assembly